MKKAGDDRSRLGLDDWSRWGLDVRQLPSLARGAWRTSFAMGLALFGRSRLAGPSRESRMITRNTAPPKKEAMTMYISGDRQAERLVAAGRGGGLQPAAGDWSLVGNGGGVDRFGGGGGVAISEFPAKLNSNGKANPN